MLATYLLHYIDGKARMHRKCEQEGDFESFRFTTYVRRYGLKCRC